MKISLRSTLTLSAFCAIAPLRGADQPKFDVVSVKHADRCSMENSIDPGMIALNGDPLSVILKEAFNVNLDRIVGPSWLDADCFVVTAKMPDGATRDQLPAMLQALLVERFKLVAHKETRMRPGYALVVDKNGPKFKESNPASAAVRAGQVTFGATAGASAIKGAMTMAMLAHFFSTRLDGPVQDLTGLTGEYDIDLSWAPNPDFESTGVGAIAPATPSPSTDDPAVVERGGSLFAVLDSDGELVPHLDKLREAEAR